LQARERQAIGSIQNKRDAPRTRALVEKSHLVVSQYIATKYWDTDGNNAPDKTIDVDGLPGPDIFFYPSLWNSPVSKAIARGVELESSWLPTDRLRVDFNLGLLQTEYQELGLAGTGAVPAVSLGSQFAGAPEETANLAVSYDIPLASGAMLLPRMDYTYTAEYTLQTGEILQRTQDAFGMLNARLTYDSGQEWTVELSVTNLTNEYYFNSGFFTRAEQIHFMTVGRPREWGLTFNYNY
jgi:iron complex outermembrane receptor protein